MKNALRNGIAVLGILTAGCYNANSVETPVNSPEIKNAADIARLKKSLPDRFIEGLEVWVEKNPMSEEVSERYGKTNLIYDLDPQHSLPVLESHKPELKTAFRFYGTNCELNVDENTDGYNFRVNLKSPESPLVREKIKGLYVDGEMVISRGTSGYEFHSVSRTSKYLEGNGAGISKEARFNSKKQMKKVIYALIEEASKRLGELERPEGSPNAEARISCESVDALLKLQ